jgi:uncharacterized protein (TIGR03032 family)
VACDARAERVKATKVSADVGADVGADRAWRHPAQVVGCWDGAAKLDPALLRYRTSGSWWECLESAGVTLLVTREYEHLVIALSVVRGKPLVSYLTLPHPSGLAVDRRNNVVHVASTRNPNQIYDLAPVHEMLPRFDMRRGPTRAQPRLAEARGEPRRQPTLMPVRARLFPGSLYLHDLAFVGNRLHANAVGHNAVVRIGEKGYDYAWWPRCVETRKGVLVQQNHLQLNSIAAGASLRSSYFSASADRVSRLRPGDPRFPVDRRGVVFSGASREPIAFGLTRPHSARLRGGRVWLLNSGYGEYGYIENGGFHRVTTLPGWTRGLCFHRRIAFVGTSRVLSRFRQYAPGLSVDRAISGVHAIDADSGRMLGSLTWPGGNQIFAIDWVPRRVVERLPFEMGAAAAPLSLFYAYRPPGVTLPKTTKAR